MNNLVRKDVFGTRLSKASASWAVAFFEGAVPTDWANMPFSVDGDSIFENCKSVSILRSSKDDDRMELIDLNEPLSSMPYGRVKETNEGYVVFPESVKVSGTKFNYDMDASFKYMGKSTALLLDSTYAAYYALPEPLVNSTLEFEFGFEFDLKSITLETYNHSYCIRGFSVQCWDAEINEGEGDWVTLGNFDHYNYRAFAKEYILSPSKGSKYRLLFTQENSSSQSALIRAIRFNTDIKPNFAALPGIVPTYCILFPLGVKEEGTYKHLPAIIASVGGPSTDADLVIDRDVYTEGQSVKLLSRFIENDSWEVV